MHTIILSATAHRRRRRLQAQHGMASFMTWAAFSLTSGTAAAPQPLQTNILEIR
jgi:hypothetical protein